MVTRSIMNRDTECPSVQGRLVPQRNQNKFGLNPGSGNCFAQVYLNNNLIYRGEGDVVPDLNMIPAHSIEAVGFYRHARKRP